MYLVSE
jgi:hypothetical protein